MSIVIPNKILLTMTSTEIQVNISDPEGVLGVIRSLYCQLQDLNAANQSLIQMNKARKERIQTTTELSEQMTEKLTDLLNSAQTMEAAVEKNTESTSSSDQELQDLLNEKERLDATAGGHIHTALDADFVNEERLNGFVEEELVRKIGELSNLQKRLTDTKEQYKNEWEQYKAEIQQYEIDKSSYEEKADHLRELQLAKFVGAHSGIDRSSSSLIKRLVEHHLNQLSHRELERKLTESRVLEKDLETEIGDLVKQKQQYWKRCLDLERCLEEIQDTSDETNVLRPTSAFLALPDVSEGVYPISGASDLDIASEHNHGRMLHRCHKNTNLVLDLSTEEREEMDESIQADTDDVNIDIEQKAQVQKEPEVTTTVADDNEELEDTVQQADTINQSKHDIDSIVEEPQIDEASTSSRTEIQLPDHIKNAVGHAGNNISFVTKLRKRVGLTGRSSSSQRIKGTPKITATSSTRSFTPGSFFRRKK